jgi:hypothetical protein
MRDAPAPQPPRPASEARYAMSVPLTLLGPLERQPSHGYDLKRDYDASRGALRLTAAMIHNS